MEQFSISVTLGKASKPHGANLDHNNRKFIAPNVDRTKTHRNITYVCCDVEDAYEHLFGAALGEYNANQKQKCRRIEDYYAHIRDGKREETFYELIVQFGDSKTAPCGSRRGEIAVKLLDEYAREFQQRNPRLHIFNSVMHLDEASPHLHIDFIPFYTQPRQRGLRVGVSMKQALIEQGFQPGGKRQNQLVAWENSERKMMEQILHRHGFEREKMHTKHKHMEVEQYKDYCELEKKKQRLALIPDVMNWTDIKNLYEHIHELEVENSLLRSQKRSPYTSFFYSDADKQSYVQARLQKEGIPFRETENGFEAQACFVERIRRIEKQYKPPYRSIRSRLRDDVDRLLMQSGSLEEFLQKLRDSGFEIKQGKYLAVRPKYGENFIRLKSLGEFYSEYVLRNRIGARLRFEHNTEAKIKAESNHDAPKFRLLRTVQLYTVAFRQNALPLRRKYQEKPYAWTNDAELNRLFLLNKRINEGATLELLRHEFAEQEERAAQQQTVVDQVERTLRSYYDLKEQIEIVFEGKRSAVFTLEQARLALQQYPSISRENYRRIDALIAEQTETLRAAKSSLSAETEKLEAASELVTAMERVMSGTYVQALVDEELHRRAADLIPNGYFLVR